MEHSTVTETKNESASCCGGEKPAEGSCCCAKKCCFPCELTLAFWVLRLWLGIRAVVTGLEKFSAIKKIAVEDEYGGVVDQVSKVYGISEHHGLPPSLAKALDAEPLMTGFGLKIFDATLGYVLIALGVTLLLGIGTRTSLFLQGVLYSMLTVGLILLGQDAGIAWLGVHIILVVAALCLAKHNKLAVLKNY